MIALGFVMSIHNILQTQEERACSRVISLLQSGLPDCDIQPLTWKSPDHNFDLEVPQVNTMKMIDCIQTLEQHQKDVLKYINTMCDNMPPQLEWVKNLSLPIGVPDNHQIPYLQHTDLWQEMHGDMPLLQAAFEVYKVTPVYDPTFSHYIASLWNPSASSYEGEIMDNLLKLNKKNEQYTLNHLEADMDNYKKRELTHQLLITARYTHLPELWTFRKDTNSIQSSFKKLNAADDWDAVSSVINTMITQPNASVLAEILDRVQTYHNKQFISDQLINTDLGSFITNITQFVEEKVPKFLLTPTLACYCKKTWGYPSLSLKYSNDKLLTIEHEPFQMLIATEQEIKPILPTNTIFLKLGETMLSPEITALTKNAHDITRFLKLKVDSFSGKEDYIVNNVNHLKSIVKDKQDILQCIKTLKSKYSGYTETQCIKLEYPVSIVGWKVDLPKKELFCLKRFPSDHNFGEPHQISRRVGADNTKLKSVSAIRQVLQSTASSTRDMVTQTIQHSFNDVVQPHSINNNAMYTVLHESVACFTLHDPTLHNIISLHASIPWTHKYQDNRYAETQLGSNSSARYRDWCNLVVGKSGGRQKSKLDAHVIKVSKVYQTYFPILQANEDKYLWINTCSSLPLQMDILHHTNDTNKTQLENLEQCVCDHMKVDDNQLGVDKDDIHVYSDLNTQTVMLAYSDPKDSDKIMHFVAFQL